MDSAKVLSILGCGCYVQVSEMELLPSPFYKFMLARPPARSPLPSYARSSHPISVLQVLTCMPGAGPSAFWADHISPRLRAPRRSYHVHECTSDSTLVYDAVTPSSVAIRNVPHGDESEEKTIRYHHFLQRDIGGYVVQVQHLQAGPPQPNIYRI